MNILPKKNWHVRTKENIARVRRDEAKAAEEEKEMERRRKLAEQEARTQLLRSRARLKLGHDDAEGAENGELEAAEQQKGIGFESGGGEVESLTNSAGHVNFFQNLEQGEKMKEGNEENAAEKKREQEEYEKKVGYLTYLGQDTEELTGEKPWWRKMPARPDPESEKTKDVGSKQKNFLDPLENLKRKLGCESETLCLKKHESVKNDVKAITHDKGKDKKLKRKRSSSSSSDNDHRKKKRRKSEKERKRSDTESDSGSDSDADHSRKKRRKSDKKKKKKDTRKHSKSSKKKKSKKKKKKNESSSSEESSSDNDSQQKKKDAKANLARLRQERLERERKERHRTNKLLYGDQKQEDDKTEDKNKPPELKQAYNSQFNPEVARQNKLDPNKKYWLE